jgi:hypothetical protein
MKVSYLFEQLWITYEFYKIWSNLGWPHDVESVWNFLVWPTGVVRSQYDVASHLVLLMFVEGFLVHASQMAPYFLVWACKFWNF